MPICYQFAEKGICRFGDGCRFEHIAGPPKNKSRSRRGRQQGQQQSTTSNFLSEFFDTYPAFTYDSSSPAMSEFYRMCDFFDWDRDDEERAEARRLFQDAIVKQFNSIYGSNGEDVGSWQNLCTVIQISPIPDRLAECREAVERAHVNICDLVDFPSTGKHPETFDSEVALSAYTRMNGKFFPMGNAYAGGLLRYLLRHIMNPSTDRGGSSGAHRQRRGGNKRH